MNIVWAVVIFFIIGLVSGYAKTEDTVVGEVNAVENSNNTIEVDDRLMKTPLEIGEISAQVKHRAKTMIGSTYVINQRKF